MTGKAQKRELSPIERTFNLGEKVNELLAAQHRKMSDLARHMGVTGSTVARMCSHNSCTLASLTKIADFFNVPITYFLPTDHRAMEEAEKDRQIDFLKGQIEVYKKAISILLTSDKKAEATKQLRTQFNGIDTVDST